MTVRYRRRYKNLPKIRTAGDFVDFVKSELEVETYAERMCTCTRCRKWWYAECGTTTECCGQTYEVPSP